MIVVSHLHPAGTGQASYVHQNNGYALAECLLVLESPAAVWVIAAGAVPLSSPFPSGLPLQAHCGGVLATALPDLPAARGDESGASMLVGYVSGTRKGTAVR